MSSMEQRLDKMISRLYNESYINQNNALNELLYLKIGRHPKNDSVAFQWVKLLGLDEK